MKTAPALLLVLVVATTSNAQWTRMSGSPSVPKRGGLAADLAGHVYAVGDSQWTRSTDEGQTWEPMTLSTATWAGGKFCVGNDNVLFAGTWHGIARSTTFGTTWEYHALADTGITALCTGAGGTVYAGTAPPLPANTWRASVVRTTDNGLTWLPSAPTWAPCTVEAIAATPEGTIFVALISHISLNGSIVRSTDAGLHWDTTYQCAGDTTIVSLAAGPDGTVFAGTLTPDFGNGPGGIALRSTDNGQTWSSLSTGFPSKGVSSFASAGSGKVLLASKGVYSSTDNGTTWTSLTAGLPGVSVYGLAKTTNSFFASTPANGIWRRPMAQITDVDDVTGSAPVYASLSQNYPNPFNPTTTVRFTLPIVSDVRLDVYDVLGRRVKSLVERRREPGVHEVRMDCSDLAGGVYFFQLQAGDFVATRRSILLK